MALIIRCLEESDETLVLLKVRDCEIVLYIMRDITNSCFFYVLQNIHILYGKVTFFTYRVMKKRELDYSICYRIKKELFLYILLFLSFHFWSNMCTVVNIHDFRRVFIFLPTDYIFMTEFLCIFQRVTISKRDGYIVDLRRRIAR